jgi:molybdopterin-guanine dinucleotide biosynthesis protein A
MRQLISCVAGAAFVAAMALPAFAADVTVKGEVVDIACATKKGEGGKGDAHAACAMACAKKGMPVGVLTSDAIYEITGDFAANSNAKLLDFVAKQVTVTGEVTEKDGKKLLNVKTIAMAK